MKKKLSAFLSSLLAIAMIVMALPLQTLAVEPDDGLTNLALGKDFIQYWVGSDGSQGTDAMQQGVKKPDGTPYSVRESEEISVNFEGAGETYENAQSGNRLTDGYIVTDPGNNTFDEDWVNTTWNDSDSTRGKYVQAYRNDSRDMILDLGSEKNINRLSLHMGDCSEYGISAPLYVTYYLATEEEGPYYLAGTCYAYAENAKYDNMASKDPNSVIPQGDEPPMAHWYYDVDGIDYNARYVRLCFDMSVWAFMDELQVFGSDAPSGSAQDLTVNEQWKPETTYDAYATSGSDDVSDNHEFLAYTGYHQNGENPDGSVKVGTTQKTYDQFLKMISYVDKNGEPTDWLFDHVTFLSHGVTKTGRYDTSRNGVTDPSKYATIEDWNQWLNHIFNTDIEDENPDGDPLNLDALEEAAGYVKEKLGDDETKVQVHISMVPPVYYQSQWCTTEQAIQFGVTTDSSVDFTMKGHGYDIEETVESRMVAMDWYLDEVISRFNAKGYQNIELAGFYYFDEVVLSTADNAAGKTITGINQLIHDKGDYESYWIPFYQAEGYKKWEEYGFDYAIMQPNYIFDAHASATRINDCASLAKKYGLGIEMEYNGTGELELSKFKEYLSKGQSVGYQKENARMAWYMVTDGLSPLVTSPTYRYLYDAIYDYINGRVPVLEPTTDLPDSNDLKGKTITIKAEPGTQYPDYADKTAQMLKAANEIASVTLTDGLYGAAWNGTIGADNPVIPFTSAAAGPFEIVADMGGKYQFNQVYLDFFTWMSAGVGIPEKVTYFVSDDGQTWTEIGSVSQAISKDLGSGLSREAYLLDTDAAGRYLKAVFSKGLQSGNKPVAPGTEGASTWGWISFDEFGAVASPQAIDLSQNILTKEMLTMTFGDPVNESQYPAVVANNNRWIQILADKKLSNGWTNSGEQFPYSSYITYNNAFVGGDMTIEANLGKPVVLSQIGINFIDKAVNTVMHPESVDFEISNDGQNWTKLANLTDYYETDYVDYANATYVLDVENVAAQYVRAVFRGQEGKWMGCDEFIVIGEAETHQVSVAAPANGTASLDKTSVESGGSAVLTFAPNSGYRLKDVKVNGVSVGKVSSPYTISNITSDTTVIVEFEKASSIPSTGGSVSEPVAPAEIDEEAVLGEIGSSEEDTVTITTTQPDVAEGSIFQAAKDAQKSIVFDVVDGNGKTEYKWEFHSEDIQNPKIAMSLKMRMAGMNEDPAVQALANGADGLILDFMHAGTLPGRARVTFDVSDKFADGSTVYLYYYNEAANRLEVSSEALEVKDGYISFDVTQCAKVIFSETAIEGAVTVDEPGASSNPQTGDTASAAAVVGGLGLGLLGLSAAYLIRRKDEQEA